MNKITGSVTQRQKIVGKLSKTAGNSLSSDHITVAYTINYTATTVSSTVKDYATVDTDEEVTTE